MTFVPLIGGYGRATMIFLQSKRTPNILKLAFPGKAYCESYLL